MRGKFKVPVVMMIMLIIVSPVLIGNAKAESNYAESVPTNFVIVRTPYDQKTIDKVIGNAYQNDKFGVILIVMIKSYTYYPTDTDEVRLYPLAIGARGPNAGEYKIKWLQIAATKYSFEGMNSEYTPRATDYYASLSITSTSDEGGFRVFNLTTGQTGDEAWWIREYIVPIHAAVAGIVAEKIVESNPATAPLAPFVGEGTTTATYYVLSNAVDRVFTTKNGGKILADSDYNPWGAADEDDRNTYVVVRGAAEANNEHSNAFIGGPMQWNLRDGVDDRVHVLTIRATLCYAKYGWYALGYGWHDEQKISTAVSVIVAPERMLRKYSTRGGDAAWTLAPEVSDPADARSYSMEVTRDNLYGTYTWRMREENTDIAPRADSGEDRTVRILTGVRTNRMDLEDVYYYYRGALPEGDYKDRYLADLPHSVEYETCRAYIWIHASDDVRVTLNINGNTLTRYVPGGTIWRVSLDLTSSGYAYITVEKFRRDRNPLYLITAYVEYLNYIGNIIGDDDDGETPPGGGGPGRPPFIPRAETSTHIRPGDTAPCVLT